MAKHGSSATELIAEYHRYGGNYCDLELNDALDEYYASGIQGHPEYDYVPRVSDYDFFNMVSVVRPHNFAPIALLGIRTGRDAMNMLYDFDLAKLVFNDAALVEEAKKLGITPGEYLDIMNGVSEYDEHDRIIRAFRLHVKLRTGDGRIPSIVLETLSGAIRYEDAEVIGFERFSGFAAHELSEAARAVKWRMSKHDYTVADIKAVYSAKPDPSKLARVHQGKDGKGSTEVAFEKVVGMSRASRLRIMKAAGSGKAALSVMHPVVIARMMDGKRFSGILDNGDTTIYMDRLIAAAGGAPSSADLPGPDDVMLYATHGVDPELVLREYAAGSSTQRIMALHEGSHAAVTDGWL